MRFSAISFYIFFVFIFLASFLHRHCVGPLLLNIAPLPVGGLQHRRYHRDLGLDRLLLE